VVPVWGILWAAGFVFFRRVNVANASALAATTVLALLVPGETVAAFLAAGSTVAEFRVFIAVLAAVILLKHSEPVRAYVEELNRKRSERRR